ncbi:hypothetical protein ACFL1X_14855, partial [Candidatus Hydrogenedentota bacterium]
KMDDLKDFAKEVEEERLSPCMACNCMTKSIRLGRANYKCGKCGHDKSLGDFYYYEATQKSPKMK